MSDINVTVNDEIVNIDVIDESVIVNIVNSPGAGVPTGGVTGQVLKKLSNSDYDTYWAIDGGGVPYLGATGDVDLGEYELKAGQLELDQTPTGTAGVAVTRWNDSVGTIETTLKGGNVVLKHGRDMFERVVNKTGIQLTKAAYQAVRISTAQGQRLGVELAQANNDTNSADTIGLVVETIDNNQEGIIYTVGEVIGINTTGSLQGETWVDGDVLYLSPTTAGRITNVKPVAPQHLVIIGYVVYAHVNNGKIYIKTTNGFELGELHDVNTTGATNGQVLKYNGTIWTPSTDVGITSLNGLTATTQTFSLDTRGNDVAIVSSGSNHEFIFPSASATRRGVLTSADWLLFFNKIGGSGTIGTMPIFTGTGTIGNSIVNITNGLVNIDGVGNLSDYALQIGTGRTNNGFAYIDLVGDATYSDYGFRLMRNNTGQNATSVLEHRGTGDFIFKTVDNANLYLQTGSTNRVFVEANSGALNIANTSAVFLANTGEQLIVNGSAKFASSITANSLVKSGGTSTQYLMADGSTSTLTNPVTGTGVSGQVSYWSGTNTQTGSNNLFWDAANNRLGIGTNTPTNILDIVLTGNSPSFRIARTGGTDFRVSASFTATGAFIGTYTASPMSFYINNATAAILDASGNFGIGATPNAWSSLKALQVGLTASVSGFTATTEGAFFSSNSFYDGATFRYIVDGFASTLLQINGEHRFQNTISGTNGNPIAFLRPMTLTANGRLLLGTTTDSGQRLQVIGDTLMRGSGNTSATTALTVQNSDGTNLLQVRNDNLLTYAGQLTLSQTGTRITFSTTGGANTNQFRFTTTSGLTSTTGGTVFLDYVAGYAPTSGTGTFIAMQYTGIINQTGGANGITRGLYVNPTLTAAADWRSIEWSNNTGWGLYGAGTANNYMAGSLGIGSTDLSGFSLRIQKTLTGATTMYGIWVGGNISSDVTGTVYMQRTRPSIAAATFTLGNLTHFNASQASIGAGVTVTNQYGFATENTLTGATNNFGFYGDIASGTGRWNLYMNGTALNYMNGSLLIGSTTDSGERLQVNGTMKVTGASTFGGNMALTLNQNAGTKITITNTTSGTGSFSNVSAISGGNSIELTKHSSLTTAYKIASASDGILYNFGADLAILNDSGSIKMAAGGSSTAQWTIGSNGDLTAADGENIIVGSTNGTKLGTATSQKIGFWNATPIVQPTTAVASATRVGGAGNTVTDTDTYDGYTLPQIVKALRNAGLLA